MRLGICSWAFAWAFGVPGREPPAHPMSAHALLDRAAELDVKVVQIGDNLPLDRLSSSELDAIVRRAGDLGIEIEVGTRGCLPDNLQNYLSIARRMNSRILRVVLDSASDEPTIDEIVARIADLRRKLEAAGVTLAIENHERFIAHEFLEIVERIDSHYVGICLDTANSFGTMEETEAVVEVLRQHVVNIHLKDFALRRADHNLGFVIEGRPAGQGQLDIPSLLRRLRQSKRDPNVILEQWPAPEETLAATIEKEAKWARESIRYLRQLVPE